MNSSTRSRIAGLSALALVIGFPLLMIALNEWAFALARAGHPAARSVRFFRTWVVPSLALVVFLRWVVLLPDDESWLAGNGDFVLGNRDRRDHGNGQQPGVRVGSARYLAEQSSQLVARSAAPDPRRDRYGDGLFDRLGRRDRGRHRDPGRHVAHCRTRAAGTSREFILRPGAA